MESDAKPKTVIFIHTDLMEGISYWFLQVIHLIHSVIAVVKLIVFINQFSPCWALTVKTKVKGWLQKSVQNLIKPPIPLAHNVPRYYYTSSVLVNRYCHRSVKIKINKIEDAVMGMSMWPQFQLVHSGPCMLFLEITFSSLWIYFFHIVQTNDAFATHGRFAFGPGKTCTNTWLDVFFFFFAILLCYGEKKMTGIELNILVVYSNCITK